MSGPPRMAPLDRMLGAIQIADSGCWEWTKYRNDRGYGQVGLREPGSRLAHRWVYEQLVEPIPDGLTLDHLCRVRHCVNPDHMEPVTQRENNARSESITAQQARQTECHKGHPFTPENTAIRPTGARRCRACDAEAARRRRRERAT